MDWDVTNIEIIGEDALKVRFRDGIEGVVRFLPDFFRGVFARLRDPSEFQQVTLEDGVVTWPGNLDLAPDTMHDEIKANGEWVLA